MIKKIKKMTPATSWRLLVIGMVISPATINMVAELKKKFKNKGKDQMTILKNNFFFLKI
jgi:hypothetical protein